MAEETKNIESGSDEIKSLKTVFIGTNVIFWILAIFMINIMWKINDQLTSLNQSVQSVMHVASMPNLDSFEIIEPAEGEEDEYMDPEAGETVYRFRRIMTPEDMDEMYGEEMMYDEAMPEGEMGTEAMPEE